MAAFVAGCFPAVGVTTQVAALAGARRRRPTTAAAAAAAPARRVALPEMGGGDPTGDGTGAPGVVDYDAKDTSVLEDEMRDATGVDADGSAAETGGVPDRSPPPAAEGKDTDVVAYGGDESVLKAESKETTGSA